MRTTLERFAIQTFAFVTFACAIFACAIFACAMSACGSEEPNPNGSGQRIEALHCNMGEVRMCPCPGGGAMGTQTCNPTGNGYDACMGCPPIEAPQGSAPMAGTTAGTVAGMTAGVTAGTSVTGGAGAATGGAGASGSMMPDSGMLDGSEPAPAGDVEPGTSCGVGLVSLCALDTEKCCARSLETDSCIAAADTCSCSLPNCAVMEAHCDGPEDCADGEHCCGTLSQNGAGYDDFTCATQCDFNGQQRAACHQQAPECPGGLTCANSQLLANVQVCIDPATIEQ